MMNNSSSMPSEPVSKSASPRMFKSDFLEYFSHVHPYTPVVVFLPVVLWFLGSSFLLPSLLIWMTPLLFLGGVLIWSLLEYILHRYIFHLEIDTEWGRRFHFFMHGIHHSYPQDKTRLVMPPGMSIPLAFVFYYLFKWVFPADYVPGLFAGLVAGYIIYDMTHYALHHFHFKSSFWKKLKQHHMKHHFVDHDNGFGVSSMLWDGVFGTMLFNKKEGKK